MASKINVRLYIPIFWLVASAKRTFGWIAFKIALGHSNNLGTFHASRIHIVGLPSITHKLAPFIATWMVQLPISNGWRPNIMSHGIDNGGLFAVFVTTLFAIVVCTYMEYFLLFKRNMYHNNHTSMGETSIGSVQKIDCFKKIELNNYGECFIHAFTINSPSTNTPPSHVMHKNPIEYPTCAITSHWC